MQSFFPASDCSEQGLRTFVADFVVAMARHFDFHGQIDPNPVSQDHPLAYRNPAEALILVSNLDQLSVISIEHRSFLVLIDLYEDGVELFFKAVHPEATPWLADFRRLASRILAGLSR